ncbi:ATPase involved in DNA repair [Roseimaritima multifibrata]|uniref:ATPase involved in DNA repair n=1 Tax=Roseimaritima multifibrata TaxID=1930274 RepID=A0A517MDN2_9BACT|nr:ATPase involved in DNA repair [Roseimaritima multifibrata]
MTVDQSMATGTYEVLRNRLRESAQLLRSKLNDLNAARAATFGTIETQLLSTERITTDHNCVPRDLIAIGNCFLFGYNVQFGLKTETNLTDVFGVFRLEDNTFHACPLSDMISDERFARDFKELYKFYKQTTFIKFFAAGPFVYMVFRVGKSASDIKTFKWRLAGDHFEYIDNRSDHEVVYPPQHAFQWKRVTRDQHRYGVHPHIAIEDRVFVEMVGGDLTIKVEDNTESGRGIYEEPVENPDQTLDDGEVHWASLGNLILLKMLPYQEREPRHLLYNAKIQKAMRLDDIQYACIMLPDDHGIIFSGGYYLQTGDYKRFEHGLTEMLYEQTLAATNGEDYLYLFYNRDEGTYIQLRYNVIRQQVDTPLVCNGQTFFENGLMVCFRAQAEPQKHHAIQLWQTPFTGPNFVPESDTDSLLFKIGNKDLVRGMAECSEVLQLIDKDDNYDGLYVDLAKKAGDILDSYFWLDKDETQHLNQPLKQIRDTANAAVEEFERVVRVRRDTEERTSAVEKAITELVKSIERSRFESIDAFVTALSELRKQRGQALALQELRYVDPDRIAGFETEIAELSERVSRRCIEFLLQESALEPYRVRIAKTETEVASVATVAEAKTIDEHIDESSKQLELLTETVSNLQIEDTTKRTQIIDQISEVFASVNRVRHQLKARINELAGDEGRAEFASQLKLLEQTVAGYLDICDTPEKCDNYLTKVMVQLEELEGRFAEFDEFISQLTERREELYNAFETRKIQLVEKRNRRAESLAAAATRILTGIESRARGMDSADQILSYFAADLMVDKVRGIVAQLQELEDAVRVGDIQSRLKTIREDAIRQLKDRQDLYEDGGDTIRLGRHRFAVNTQPLDLTTVLREGELALHLTGTQFFEPLQHEDLLNAKDLWTQELANENPNVYRAEFLAVDLFEQWRKQIPSMRPKVDMDWLRLQIRGRFAEGYAKGVHDADAFKILDALVKIDQRIGLLRHSPTVRAAAMLWWTRILAADKRTQKKLIAWIHGFANLASAFPNAEPSVEFRATLSKLYNEASESADGEDKLCLKSLFPTVTPTAIANYLFEHLISQASSFTISGQAEKMRANFDASLPAADRKRWLEDSLQANAGQPLQIFVLARNWADAFLKSNRPALGNDQPDAYRDELAILLAYRNDLETTPLSVEVGVDLEGMAGAHPRIQAGLLPLQYHEIQARIGDYQNNTLPRYRQLQETKHQLVDDARTAMRLEEFRPRVLTSFVRNQLLDEVYLPLIGDNFAKQMGTSGENKRTDRMGMLLLISPPGYGKTTLMEYIANRLGLVFMKINGPAIGHSVTSLDPAEAPNAAAREEVERLNLALEMGDNVLLYLDDIQHTNPEFLQKFISLCDATRKIEGVRNGETRTYDLRGRRVAVVMAGNPYTESGDRFQIPDMLSNRADVYNLGEIIGESREAFEISYLENCLTSNTVLAPLAAASPADARALIHAAERGNMDDLQLESNFSADAVREMFEVLKKLLVVRDCVLKVNRQYIRSAAQADAYRTEPAFKLQGSYRNMNRMAERVVSVMNDAELQSLIISNYEQDAQTLTTDNESNVLKFKELNGLLTAAEKERWESIKYAFVESIKMAGLDSDDQAGQLMRQLGSMRDGLESIRQVIARAVASGGDSAEVRMDERVENLRQSFSAAGQQLTEALQKTSKQLEQISTQQASNPPEQNVIVQHKMPRVMLNLIRGQFHLMQEWMRPLTMEATRNGKDLEKLKSLVETTLQDYDRMQTELEGAAGILKEDDQQEE